MRSKLRRVRGLVQRYRVDRRLPPQVLDLYRETLALRRREARSRRRAERRTVIGAPVDGGDVGRSGDRRMVVTGPLSCSTADLGHAVAGRVVDVLQEAGVDAFIVDRCGDGFEFGIPIVDRTRALAALREHLLDEAGWYLRWFDRSADGLLDPRRSGGDRRADRARSWSVFRLHGFGDQAIGEDQGVHISFWEVGSSGQMERVGTRGHERFDVRSAPRSQVVDGRSYPGNSAFPVGANFEYMTDPVDFVFTWVDGDDPEWRASFVAAARAAGRAVDEVALDPARYRSRDELRYALRSAFTYCGWVRRIWIVTSGQTPSWLEPDDRVAVVDHRDILPAEALPTFNSHAIESALHHIDELAEHFVYFNDDMLIGRPVRPELFFTSNGLARVFQSGARVEGAEDEHTLAVDTGALRGRELLEQRFGRVVSHKPYHAPYPLRRSTLDRMEHEFPEIVQRTALSRFRSPSDLSIAASFGQHYGLGVGDSVIGDIAAEYVHVESGRLQWHLDRIRIGRRFDTFCINETNAGLVGTRDRERRIAEFFESVQPVPAPWERLDP